MASCLSCLYPLPGTCSAQLSSQVFSACPCLLQATFSQPPRCPLALAGLLLTLAAPLNPGDFWVSALLLHSCSGSSCTQSLVCCLSSYPHSFPSNRSVFSFWPGQVMIVGHQNEANVLVCQPKPQETLCAVCFCFLLREGQSWLVQEGRCETDTSGTELTQLRCSSQAQPKADPQLTHKLRRKRPSYALEPSSFGVVCYPAIANWHMDQKHLAPIPVLWLCSTQT